MQPKWILFGIAVFNYVLFWSLAHRMRGACVVCPWYYPWSNINEPTLLLVAGSLVVLEKRWSLALSLVLSGYLVGFLISLYVVHDLNPLAMLLDARFSFIRLPQTQYVFAVVILLASVIYLVRIFHLNRVNASQQPTSAWSGLAGE
jgi:hypothetical protein